MPRYISKPKAYWEYGEWRGEEISRPSLTVRATDAEHTGLLDQYGNELVRLPDKIGFVPGD